MINRFFFFKTSVFILISLFSPKADPIWQNLGPGLKFGVFKSPFYSDSVKGRIRVLKIDPDRYDFLLLNASATEEGKNLSVKKWCKKHNLVAAINAAMYQTDYKTSVSLMKSSKHVNNSRLSKDKTILAFDRINNSVPSLKIIDLQCDDFGFWKQEYRSFVQSIRMISCKGANVWSKNQPKWSIAAIGTDKTGNVLLIHSELPHTVHNLINIIKDLPLNIERAMYLEGGSEAQLALITEDKEFEWVGQYSETGLYPSVTPHIPNVIGIARK